jgi:hypothetical protein
MTHAISRNRFSIGATQSPFFGQWRSVHTSAHFYPSIMVCPRSLLSMAAVCSRGVMLAPSPFAHRFSSAVLCCCVRRASIGARWHAWCRRNSNNSCTCLSRKFRSARGTHRGNTPRHKGRGNTAVRLLTPCCMLACLLCDPQSLEAENAELRLKLKVSTVQADGRAHWPGCSSWLECEAHCFLFSL